MIWLFFLKHFIINIRLTFNLKLIFQKFSYEFYFFYIFGIVIYYYSYIHLTGHHLRGSRQESRNVPSAAHARSHVQVIITRKKKIIMVSQQIFVVSNLPSILMTWLKNWKEIRREDGSENTVVVNKRISLEKKSFKINLLLWSKPFADSLLATTKL